MQPQDKSEAQRLVKEIRELVRWRHCFDWKWHNFNNYHKIIGEVGSKIDKLDKLLNKENADATTKTEENFME